MNNSKAGEDAVNTSDSSTSTSFQEIASELNPVVESQAETNQIHVDNIENTIRGNPEQRGNGEHQQNQPNYEEGQTSSHHDFSVHTTNNYGVPLLAPILFNRPPFDVEDFRRRLASTNRHANENEPVEGDIAGGDNDRVQAPAVIPAREVAQVGLNDTPLTRALAMGEFDLAERLIMSLNDPEYLNDGKFT